MTQTNKQYAPASCASCGGTGDVAGARCITCSGKGQGIGRTTGSGVFSMWRKGENGDPQMWLLPRDRLGTSGQTKYFVMMKRGTGR